MTDKLDLKGLTNDVLIAAYRKIRDARDEAKKKFSESQASTVQSLERIEGELLRRMHESETNSFRCDSGTAFKKLDTSITVKEWDAYLAFCLGDADRLELLGRHAAKVAVMEFIAKTGEVPPGLNISQREIVNVRAPTESID